jgi:hypothetical protein
MKIYEEVELYTSTIHLGTRWSFPLTLKRYYPMYCLSASTQQVWVWVKQKRKPPLADSNPSKITETVYL